MIRHMWLWVGAGGCVVGGVDEGWSFDNVVGVQIDLANGEVEVQSGVDSTARVSYEGGGVGLAAWPYVESIDGWLFIDADGDLGGGEIRVVAPPGVPVLATVDRGEVTVDRDEPADVSVVLGAGSAQIGVPGGAYNLELSVLAGAISLDGVYHQPAAPHTIEVALATGDLSVYASGL